MLVWWTLQCYQQSCPQAMLPADVLGTGQGCSSTPCTPNSSGQPSHTWQAQEPRDLGTANKECSGDNLFRKAPRQAWLNSQRVSKLIKKTKISTTKAADRSQITANTTRDRRKGKSSCLTLSPTSGTSLSSSKHSPSSGCIAKMMWRELMCANTCVIVCSGSQTSCDHSNTPTWESELSYASRGRGAACAQPWAGRNNHREGMKMQQN